VVKVENTTVADDAEITTGNGRDQVILQNVQVTDDLAVKTGNGNDEVVSGAGTTVGDNALFDGGRNSDGRMIDPTGANRETIKNFERAAALDKSIADFNTDFDNLVTDLVNALADLAT
jgi:hypothetical protein